MSTSDNLVIVNMFHVIFAQGYTKINGNGHITLDEEIYRDNVVIAKE